MRRKKILLIIIVALVLIGGIVAGLAWTTYPRRHNAVWDSVRGIWQYSGIPGSTLPFSYDLTDAKEYRDDQRHFSFKYPNAWQIERRDDNKEIFFFVKRDTLLWPPEHSPASTVTLDKRSETGYYLTRQKEHNYGVEKEHMQWLGGLPWIVIDLPKGDRKRSVFPYPKGVLEFGSWRLMVNNFHPDIFKSFRYNTYTSFNDSKTQLWPKEPGIDMSSWKDFEISKLGVAVKYPPNWYVYDCLEQGDRAAVTISSISPDLLYPENCKSDGSWESDIGVIRISSPLTTTYNMSQVDISNNSRFGLNSLIGYWNQDRSEIIVPPEVADPGRPVTRTSVFIARTLYGGHIFFSFTQYYKRNEEKAADSELKIFKAFLGNVKAIPLE